MQGTFQVKYLDEESRIALFNSYRSSEKRLILLDYDGTLVSFYPEPELALPGVQLRRLLSDLSSKKENDLFVISGRSSQWLEMHLGDLPINLIAEHGARYKWKGADWRTEIISHEDWKGGARAIMADYVTKCTESLIEEKEFSMVWHYRKCAIEEGKSNAKDLSHELNEFISDKNLQVLPGNKIIELRQLGIDKGIFLKKIIDRKDYDFTMAIGDDRTDEDMFKALIGRTNTYTIKVGQEASYAQFNLHTPQMVISLLEALSNLR
jgi:trehalose 6-phosphate synthase/phosphatase